MPARNGSQVLNARPAAFSRPNGERVHRISGFAGGDQDLPNSVAGLLPYRVEL